MFKLFRRKPRPKLSLAEYHAILGRRRIAVWEEMTRQGEAYRIISEAASRTPRP